MKHFCVALYLVFISGNLGLNVWAEGPKANSQKKTERRDGLAVGMFQRGLASYYAEKFHGRRTASGERFDMNAMSAAHKTLPFGTLVLVRHLETGREIRVRINDRGPFVRDRVIDLSKRAARELGMLLSGVAPVKLIILALPKERKPIRSVNEPAVPLPQKRELERDVAESQENQAAQKTESPGGAPNPTIPFPLRRRLAIQIASYARLEPAKRQHQHLEHSELPVHLEQHGKYYRLIIENLNPEQVSHYRGKLARLGLKKVLVRQE